MDKNKFKCTSCNKEVELIQHEDDSISCSCHIMSPCDKCANTREECPNCGEVYEDAYEDDTFSNLPEPPLPQSSIDDGISYRIKRGGSWVIAFGTHKKGMSREDVKNKLAKINKYNGTFHKWDMFMISYFTETEFEASWCND